jgi:hypothetical protein
MNFLDRNVPASLQTHLAERMLPDVAITDPLPGTSVTLAGGVATLKVFIVMFHQLLVFLTVLLTLIA